MKLKKYDIVVVNFYPTRGKEMFGIRPGLVLQTNALNGFDIGSFAVAPMTKHLRDWSTAVVVEKSALNRLGHDSRIELSQITTIDEARILKRLGVLDQKYRPELREKLENFFDLDDEF